MATTFGTVTDYFGLESATLVAESSDGGENKQHVVAYNATNQTTAFEDGTGVWMNPRVTYRVVGSMTLNVTLGKGFAGKVYNSGNTHRVEQSGYMITSVEIHTAIGEAPTVTVSAVANEGFKHRNPPSAMLDAAATDAVKTYAVSVSLSPRHRCQRLFSCISGGVDFQELTATAICDPVVLAENNMPCASDVVHGRIEVSAVIADYAGTNAPTAGTGFSIVGNPISYRGTGYKTIRLNVRKEL